MTAPHCAQPITPEIVERFAAYYRKHPSWGAFHVCLDDGNWWASAFPVDDDDEERVLVAIFDRLTESQRRRLAGKAIAKSREPTVVYIIDGAEVSEAEALRPVDACHRSEVG